MKRYILTAILLIASYSLYAQKDSIRAPYLRFPNFPPVKLILPDKTEFSKNDLDKKSPVMLMLFSPQCEHCQHETEELTRNMEKFRKIQIVMATIMPFDSMLAFRDKYGLAKYENLIIGYDKQYFLPTFYSIRNLPFHAFYNRKKELISAFEGTISIEKVLEEFKK